MKILLFWSLLIWPVWAIPNQTDANFPIEVVRFSWSKNRAGNSDESRPASANPARREFDYLREMANRGSVEERSRAMRELEEKTARESRHPQTVELYRYRVELRNRGSQVIKGVFVDYQTSAANDPDNPSHRQFACSGTIKPNQSKLMEGFTNLPPHRVVSALNPDKPLIERLIINRIEFSDGEIWQRSDWKAPDRIPGKGANQGQCRAI